MIKCTKIHVMEVLERIGEARWKGPGRIFKEIMTDNLPNLMQDMNLHIQDDKWTLNRINLLRYVNNKTVKRERQRNNTESNNWKVSHQLQGILNKINNWFIRFVHLKLQTPVGNYPVWPFDMFKNTERKKVVNKEFYIHQTILKMKAKLR